MFLGLRSGLKRSVWTCAVQHQKLQLQSLKQAPVGHLLQPQVQFKRGLKTSTVDWKPIRASSDEKKRFSFGKGVLLSLLILMPIVSFYLGTWQLRRLNWKRRMIRTCEDRLTFAPTPFPKDFDPKDAEDNQFHKYLVTGKFDHSKELFVGPKIQNEMKGYTLFTPLIRSDGGEPVLIERGFITDEMVLPPKRKLQHLSLPEQEVTVECILKKINPKAPLTWDKLDPDSRVWHVLNVDEMTEAVGCLPVHLVALRDLNDHPVEKIVVRDSPWWNFWNKKEHTEVVNRELKEGEIQKEFNQWQLLKNGVPLGKVPSIDLRNNHLQYIVTWYGLGIMSSILLFVVLKKKPTNAMQDKIKHANFYS